MKKQFLTMMLTAGLVLGNGGSALAADGSVQDWASSDAEQAVISQQPVNEGAVRQRGGEYTAAFLESFAQASRNYQRAYYQGKWDGQNDRPAAPPADRVGRVAYQRGYEQGAKEIVVQQPGVSSNIPNPQPENGQVEAKGEQASPAPDQGKDQEEYPDQQLNPDQAKFIKRIAKTAQKVGMEYDLYPSIIIAQAALESNWGASDLARQPYHNLFGVKGAFNGRMVQQPTIEYTKEGKQLRIKDYFRWYDNDYQSLCDYAETLNDPLYEGVHRSRAGSYRQATHALLGRYATDPQYDRKLNRVIDSYQLTKYDQPGHRESGDKTKVITPVAESAVHDRQAPVTKRHHQIGWLSTIGGVGSAGALGLLRRFIS